MIYKGKDGKIIVEFKAVANGGYRCENCDFYAVVVPHYCPSCALATTNPDDK